MTYFLAFSSPCFRAAGDARCGCNRPAAAIGLTAYLVPVVNRRLQSNESLGSPQERQRVVAFWNPTNGLRLAALATGALALRRAAAQLR